MTKSNIDPNTLLSEAALAKDWLRPEEYIAWAHLQNKNSDLKSEIN